MKQLIPIFALAVMMTACTSNPSTNIQPGAATQPQQELASNPDTVGLAQFQQWKAAHELAAVTEYKVQQAQRTAPVKRVKKAYTAPVARTETTANNPNSSIADDLDGGAMSSESTNAAKVPEKKGWSKAAKGTAIGAGTGAVAGAVIGKKNRVVGGVIGGVVGGAVGYGIGRHMDKRDGRY